MDRLLTNRTAVVTGSASGIGRAIAKRFAEQGADIVVADLEEKPREGGQPTHEYIQSETDVSSEYIACDVTNRGDLVEAMGVAEKFGGVDVMVNNAGIYWTESFLEISEEDYDQMVAVNQKGMFFGAQAATDKMIENGGGNIINMSSIAGLLGYNEHSVYCMTKGAVRLLTYALAKELGPAGIRVNAIHPGTIRTAMTTEDEPLLDDSEAEQQTRNGISLQSIGTPEDVADTALYLASDLGGYITGESISVDGGMANIG